MPYVANKSNMAQLTNVHYWSTALGAWSGNLIGAPLPLQFLPNPVAVGDLVLFGIDTTILDSGPFCSIVFDIATAIVDVTGITWKRSDAVSVDPLLWPAQTVQDNTDQGGAMTGVAFDTAGIGSVHWQQNVNWVVQNPAVGVGPALGITGYWISAEVTAIGAAPAPPVQQNRDFYTVTWAHTETAEIGGDLHGLADTTLRNAADTAIQALGINHLYVGSRRTSRGAGFVPFTNVGGLQNPAGILWAAGADAAPFADPTTATGQVMRTAFPIPGVNAVAAMVMTNAIEDQYRGTFRVFMRVRQTGGAGGDVSVAFTLTSLQATFASQYMTIQAGSVGNYDLLDFGDWTLPVQELLPTETTGANLLVSVVAQDAGAAATLDVAEFIFLPVDENAVEIFAAVGWSPWARTDGIDLRLDSIQHPKQQFRSLTYTAVGGAYGYFDSTGGRMEMLDNRTQRHYFLSQELQTAPGLSAARCANCYQVDSWAAIQRYSSMRGAR